MSTHKIDWNSVTWGIKSDAEVSQDLGTHRGTVAMYRRRNHIPAYVRRSRDDEFRKLPLGKKPDSIISRESDIPYTTVVRYRTKLGIPPYPGRFRSQENGPLRSQWEAKYDAYLHYNMIEHIHEPQFRKLGVIPDFQIGEYFVEIVGMMSLSHYRKRVQEKKDIYKKAAMSVLWIEPNEVDRLYSDCDLPLKYTEYAVCVDCNKPHNNLSKGRCAACYRTYIRQTNVECRVCVECGIAFEAYVHSTTLHCNKLCYYKKAPYNKIDIDPESVDWTMKNRELAELLSVSISTIKRIRRKSNNTHQKRIDLGPVDWTMKNRELAELLSVSISTIKRRRVEEG